MITKKTLGCASIIALMVGVACSSNDDDPPSNNPSSDACANIEQDVKNSFDLLAKFVSIQTYREENWANEDKVTEGMAAIYAELKKEVDQINAGQKTSKLDILEWAESSDDKGVRQEGEPPKWRVFKISLGKGPRRVAIATHLDTVHPGDTSWDPFTLKKTVHNYDNKTGEEFWQGRGSIDDKGPAVATLKVMGAIAKKYDGNPLLDKITVELIFDTSEETAMSMPNYFRLKPQEEPNLAVIFDANWCVRAEKGVERPIFTIKKDAAKPTKGIWIDSFNTPAGPANQIPDSTTAIIKMADKTKLDALATAIKAEYESFVFDNDPTYRRAELAVTREGDTVKLVTKVAGAQHGSKPEENRADGANPLASLATFLAVKATKDKWEENDVTRMVKFIEWTWGTQVFGEKHPPLKASDDIFEAPNNGTTYAVTRFDDAGKDEAYPDSIVFKVDIRYAQDHHGSPRWNKQTEGFIDQMQAKPSFSKFKDIFAQLVPQFNGANNPHEVRAYVKETRPKGPESPVPPDVRKTDGPTFSRVSKAYEKVEKKPCPAIAIGGGTDAKNHANFLAAGALFSTKFGPPINFHGLSEAAPVNELTKSAKIVCQFLDDEVSSADKPVEGGVSTSAATMWKSVDHELH